jgi:hypothetical protein
MVCFMPYFYFRDIFGWSIANRFCFEDIIGSAAGEFQGKTFGGTEKRNMKILRVWIVNVLSLVIITSCASSEITSAVLPSQTAANTITPFVVTLDMTSTPVVPRPEVTFSPTPRIVYESTSPDARWSAITSREFIDGEERSILRASNDQGKVAWEVENKPFIEEPPTGFWFPVPIHWSNDGKYLYFAHRANGDGCFGGNNHSGRDLQRLDLVTGEVNDISPGGTYLAISPDEKYLATVSFAKEGIKIQDLETGDTKALDLLVRQEDVGFELDQRYITWSPDSRSLVFVIMAGVCDGTVESYFNWIVRVDMQSLSQQFLTEKDEQALVPISWVGQDKILVRDKDGKLWGMNANTGAISSVE